MSPDPPGDALAHNVLDLLIVQRHHKDLRTWLAFLAQDAVVGVGERLLRAGVVEPVTHRNLRGTQTLYMPMNPSQRNTAAWATSRLANLLVHDRPMELGDRLLAGLVVATGLTRYVLRQTMMLTLASTWVVPPTVEPDVGKVTVTTRLPTSWAKAGGGEAHPVHRGRCAGRRVPARAR